MSDFLKPAFISNNLCDFLGRYYGTKLTRAEVIKEICNYIKKKNLQDPGDQRIIILDNRLATLLKCSEPLTYFGIQKRIQAHFLSIAEIRSIQNDYPISSDLLNSKN